MMRWGEIEGQKHCDAASGHYWPSDDNNVRRRTICFRWPCIEPRWCQWLRILSGREQDGTTADRATQDNAQFHMGKFVISGIFAFNIFRLQLTRGNWNQKTVTLWMGDYWVSEYSILFLLNKTCPQEKLFYHSLTCWGFTKPNQTEVKDIPNTSPFYTFHPI